MNRGKIAALAWLLALSLILTACGGGKKQEDFSPGETVETYWFDFAVGEVLQADSWQGWEAQEGSRLVICALSLRSTFDSPVPMGRGDFALLWESGERPGPEDVGPWAEMEGVYPLPAGSAGQLPDEYELDPGEERTGRLVFQVPDEVTRAALMFEEYYVSGESEDDYAVGGHYMVWLDLGDGPEPAEEE